MSGMVEHCSYSSFCMVFGSVCTNKETDLDDGVLLEPSRINCAAGRVGILKTQTLEHNIEILATQQQRPEETEDVVKETKKSVLDVHKKRPPLP